MVHLFLPSLFIHNIEFLLAEKRRQNFPVADVTFVYAARIFSRTQIGIGGFKYSQLPSNRLNVRPFSICFLICIILMLAQITYVALQTTVESINQGCYQIFIRRSDCRRESLPKSEATFSSACRITLVFIVSRLAGVQQHARTTCCSSFTELFSLQDDR